MNCIYGIDASSALVSGSGSTSYVYKTSNGGNTWTQVFSQVGGFINSILKSCKVSHPNELVLTGTPVGGRWTIFASDDYGTTWDSSGVLNIPQVGSETGFNNSATVIHHPGGVVAWFGTNNTRMYRFFTDDGNAGFISQPTTGQAYIISINFADSLIGFAGGSTGLLFTSNSGSNWSSVSGVPGSGSINGISYTDNIGEVFITRGTSIYKTTNAGVNWSVATTQTGTYKYMQGVDNRTQGNFNIWAIRDNGGISKYTFTIGIKSISTEVPSNYSLSQNYPNPFNPTTNVQFSIPNVQFVTLKVYDILGKEVATLVNEKLNAGTYETSFDGSNLTSGIYFYSLETQSYKETKKMIMIK
ncbi:MAG: T9SS type A sorting domain-containing protein [Ignavibacteriae bacterium]|nr:T9SS type A sorting domain-containing protein [Ignavibacteriota bacterium]